jgi:hypothetical protein
VVRLLVFTHDGSSSYCAQTQSKLAVVVDLGVAPFAGTAAVPVIFRDDPHALCEPSAEGWVSAVVYCDANFGQTERLGRLRAARTEKQRAGEPDDYPLKLGVVADAGGERGNVARLAKVARADEDLVGAAGTPVALRRV